MNYERMRITSGGNINIRNGNLNFNDITSDMRIQLYGGYGFGFNGGVLRYNSCGSHTWHPEVKVP